MGRLSVAEAAERLGVGVPRVHQRIADGSLLAERVGSQWILDEADVARVDQHGAGRPLSARSAWHLLLAAEADLPAEGRAASSGGLAGGGDGDAWGRERPGAADLLRELAAPARSQARRRLRELLQADPAAERVRALLRRRAERRTYRASPRDLRELREDDRLQLAGLSQPAAGLAAGNLVEGYVRGAGVVDDLVADWLLVPSLHADASVVLHVVDVEIPSPWIRPHCWLVLAADLAEHHQSREEGRAVALLHEASDRLPAARRR